MKIDVCIQMCLRARSHNKKWSEPFRNWRWRRSKKRTFNRLCHRHFSKEKKQVKRNKYSENTCGRRAKETGNDMLTNTSARIGYVCRHFFSDVIFVCRRYCYGLPMHPSRLLCYRKSVLHTQTKPHLHTHTRVRIHYARTYWNVVNRNCIWHKRGEQMCIQTYVIPWFTPFAPSLRSFAENAWNCVRWLRDDNENVCAILPTTIQ